MEEAPPVPFNARTLGACTEAGGMLRPRNQNGADILESLEHDIFHACWSDSFATLAGQEMEQN